MQELGAGGKRGLVSVNGSLYDDTSDDAVAAGVEECLSTRLRTRPRLGLRLLPTPLDSLVVHPVVAKNHLSLKKTFEKHKFEKDKEDAGDVYGERCIGREMRW